ncbi:MAG: hypothetical protein JNL74_14570, partial [Fibrobacteres bacterium]|nr:hypothetical protein [Fibrobacterota bacterium]
QSQRTYYFAINERAPKPGAVLYGDIASANDTSFLTADYAEPSNIAIAVTDSSADSIRYKLNTANLLLPENSDVKNVLIYYGTNASAISSTYKTALPARTLTKVEALLADTLNLSGLAEGTKYYIAVAVKDSADNWCTSVNFDSVRTKIKNPLSINVVKRANNNRLVAVAVNNATLLGPKVDSLRFWYKINPVRYVPDAQALIAADTVVARALLGDTVYITLPDNISQRYCFSVVPSIFEENRTWAAPTTDAATDTINYDSDEPANLLTLSLSDTTLTSMIVVPQSALYLNGTDVDSMYLWVYKVGGSVDSGTLASQFRVLPPRSVVSVDDINLGRITNLSLAGLDTGSYYFCAIAPKDTNTNYSNFANVYRFKTGSAPLNPLTLTGFAPLSSFARITISNLHSLAANIDKSWIKLLVSTAGYNTDGYDSVNVRYFNLFDSTGNSARVDVSGLTQLTRYYVTIAVMNDRRWISRITLPQNGCTFVTPQSLDSIAPNGSFLRFRADPSPFSPLTQLAVTIEGLNSLSSADRSNAVVRVCWSPAAYNNNVKVPPPGVGYFDFPLSAYVGDSIKDELVYPLRPGSIKLGHGLPYYLTMAIRDSAYNWDTLHIKQAFNYTDMDTVRPVNDTTWLLTRNGFTDLRVSWNPPFFNRIPLSFRDTVPKLGIWLRTDSFTQAYVDTASPNILMDSGSATPRSFPILTHNTRYYVACAPINTIDNRGRIRTNKSLFIINVPFDSSTISPPPNLCTLSVAHTTIPESLKVRWKLPAIQYTDLNNGIQVQLTQIMVRYKTDGTYPLSTSDGFLAGIFNLTPSLFDSTIIGGFPLNTDVRFTAFVINQLSGTYPNRISGSASTATASIRTLFYPENRVVFDRLTTQGGGGLPVKLRVQWHISSGTLPTAVRFLIRTPADTPSSWNAPAYSVYTPSVIAYNPVTDVIPDTLLNSVRYIVAAFVRNSDGVWSRAVVCDTITTPSGIDVIAPPRLPFALTGKKLDSRNVRLYWTIDSLTLAAANASENNRLSLIYGITNAGPDTFLNPANSKPYLNPLYKLTSFSAVDSLTLSNLIPGRTYTFAVSTSDTVNNQALTDSLSWTQLTLSIPSIPDSNVTLSLRDDANYILDWSKNVTATGRRLWMADTNIRLVTYVLQRDSAYTGSFPLVDEIGDRLIRTNSIDSLRFAENRFNWDQSPYYLTMWPTIDRALGYAGPALVKGPYRYIIDPPRLDSVELVQVKDTLVRLSFIPRDTTENEIRLGLVSYGVNRLPNRVVLRTAYDTTQINLNLDTIPVNRRCSVYIHLNRLDQTEWNLLSGKDTSRLYFKIDISDMRPILKSTPDTSYLCSLRIDNKGPTNSELSIQYTRATRELQVRLIPSSGDQIESVIWGLNQSFIVDTFTQITAGDTIKIDSVGINGVFLRLTDRYGNIRDTLWNDFESVRLPFRDLYSINNTTTKLDNGGVVLGVPQDAILVTAYNNGYLTVGLQSLPNDSSALASKGFVNAQPERYFFLSEMTNLTTPTNYYKNGIDIGFKTTLTQDTGAKVYRLYSDGTIQALGGEYDTSTGMVWLRKYSPGSIWYSQVNSAPAQTDTFVLIVTKDIIKPVVDSTTSGIILTKSDSAKIVFKAKDNTIRMRAGFRIFTFKPERTDSAPVILWDTVTTALVSGKRGQPSLVNDTAINCEFDFTSSLRAKKAFWTKCGLYYSAWVSDGIKKYFFHSYPVAVDSVTGRFNSLNNNWTVVNINAVPESKTDLLNAFQGNLKNNYDRTLVRLYTVKDNKWLEYSRNDTSFFIAPGKAFALVTRKSNDNSIAYSTEKATLPDVK